ncbi:MAG TPA: hypothetical protein VHF22_02150 [Planctomycetota bacterium]|nr:hypothetical protein [Planctomycetota bacterium]
MNARLVLPLFLILATPALAQVAQPADEAKSHGSAQPMTPPAERDSGKAPRLPSYQQPALEGTDAESSGGIGDEEKIGAYGSPRWTAHRRFAETRVYVRPQGFFELEWWFKPEIEHGGGGSVETVQEFEAELGLGHRLQLDFYLDTVKVGHEDNFDLDGFKMELRYAFADWGVIPGNPTAYLEYHESKGGSDSVEGKLLLGGEIAPRWHWGLNLVFERNITDDLDNNYEWTGGISYTVTDMYDRTIGGLSVGAEVKQENHDLPGRRGNMIETLQIGPSFQWRPLPAAHVDFVPLFGCTGFSPQFEPVVVVGWEF